MIVVVSLNPDGTAAVTTPVPQAGETEADALARVLAATPGGEPLSAELAAALLAGDTPPGSPLPAAEFYKRLAPIYLTLAAAPAEVQTKWDRIIGGGGLLSKFDRVALTDPTLRAMVGAAVADRLMTQEQAADVLRPAD